MIFQLHIVLIVEPGRVGGTPFTAVLVTQDDDGGASSRFSHVDGRLQTESQGERQNKRIQNIILKFKRWVSEMEIVTCERAERIDLEFTSLVFADCLTTHLLIYINLKLAPPPSRYKITGWWEVSGGEDKLSGITCYLY